RARAAELDGAAARPPLSPMEQRLTVSVTQKPLAEVIAAVAGQCDVSVTGLEDRSRENITFSAEDEPVETAVKRLLRNLDETNYVFFYSLTQLRQVSVMPRSKKVAQAPLDMPAAEAPREESPELPEGQELQEQAVRVINVNAGTQAEALQLQRGDLVVEYNGVRIENSQQLVAMVKQKSEEDTVEMVVVRDGEPLRMTLKGGMIGINVRTVAVPGPGSETE
ncbi:PDZ domain-containing protein, partial [Desulfococcus sp.]|uniref:PDZ domain-containing protein n=1 Tax=Desulfococcus sp. TaxID=2025834 RepID=UPI00359366E1